MSRAPAPVAAQEPQLLGHPVGLFTLFFAEMWERFSYYGMRALLFFYMTKGFLGFLDEKGYRIYGAYTALVYMTPFFGGLIADRILGARRSVILGGLLMAAGHLMMTVERGLAFYLALALLICGNGFFKPNISTLVGSLYTRDSTQRDAGFTIFYIGINLGAAMSPLLCGYIGENYGWHRGFGLATIGMLTGLAVFVAPNVWSQMLLLAACGCTSWGLFGQGLAGPTNTSLTVLAMLPLFLAGVVSFLAMSDRPRDSSARRASTYMNMLLVAAGALFAIFGMLRLYEDSSLVAKVWAAPGENVEKLIDLFVTVCLFAAAAVACGALARGGLPVEAGMPRDPALLRRRLWGPLSVEWAVYAGALLAVPVLMMFVCGFDPLDRQAGGVSFASRETVESLTSSRSIARQVAGVFLHEFGSPAGLCLLAAGIGALGYVIAEMRKLSRVAVHRLCVALILTFFSFVFWALFEQAGSSLNAFADRNIDRVSQRRLVTADEVGTTLNLEPTQEQLGHDNGEKLFTLGELTRLRETHVEPDFTIEWQVVPSNVGMGVAERRDEVAASTYQAINPFYILILGLVFTALWSFLGSVGWEPSTPLKFSLGLLQLGLGFAAFWYGAAHHDPRGMVWVGWLFLGYLLHTTGELCLSPVGLSMITRLSPRHLVSTMMGMWFLATSLSQFLAGIIAQFTKVDATGMVAEPIVTVAKYGGVYGFLAGLAVGAAACCLVLVPLLKAWMHEGELDESWAES